MAQRIEGIHDEVARDAARQIFAASEKMLGRTANLVRILAHSPDLGRWFLGLVAAVRQPNAGAVADVRLRNLATLKTSVVNGCNY